MKKLQNKIKNIKYYINANYEDLDEDYVKALMTERNKYKKQLHFLNKRNHSIKKIFNLDI